MNKYIGNPMQIRGVEEHRLCGGKGDGMRLFQIRNGKGLEITVSADRCADISRLTYKGVNFGYFSPCGYVAPSYYDSVGAGFLKSFTAGFFTTCGLTAVGSPCNDNGEELPLHGSISNTPAENIYYTDDDNFIYLKATVRDAALFAHKLLLKREYKISLSNNSVELCDTVTNTGSEKSPYHVDFSSISKFFEIKLQKGVDRIPTHAYLASTDAALAASTAHCIGRQQIRIAGSPGVNRGTNSCPL